MEHPEHHHNVPGHPATMQDEMMDNHAMPSHPQPHPHTEPDHAMDAMEHAGQSGSHADHSGHEQMFRQRLWRCLLLTSPVLLFSPMIQTWFGFQTPEFPGSQFIGPAFAIIIFFYGGIPFLQMAVPEIRSRTPGMMTLISMAITAAFAYSLLAVFISPMSGFFWEMATLIDIMLLGHWLEMRSVRQASGALNELAKLMPDMAELVQTDGSTKQVSVNTLHRGDLVLVRPGASIPADGEVAEGHSAVNEAMISGESRPVTKEPGAKVIAGTINGEGSLRVRVTATGKDTALAGIMRLVEQAQQSKSNTQILADKAAGWLFYVAVAVAALTAVGWTLASGLHLDILERVVTVLVIACPHALGLAIPLVVAISTSLGARNGILVRDRLALEKARLINTVIFDKTGTLTEGRFGVVDMAVIDGWTKEEALALAAAVEGDSEHPIAQGIRRKAEELQAKVVQVSDFEALKGRGIKATYRGHSVFAGGPRLLEFLNISLPENLARFAATADAKGQTAVYLIQDNQPIAALALADAIRPESKAAVRRVNEMGIQVAMLTGDSRAVANGVAGELGIDTVFAEVLPEHKEQKIADLQREGKKVAMVGDGVNDAPALIRADVGIAIGSGTDVAIESAGIILVQSNPLDVVKIFELSRATYRKMIQNLLWATGYNVLALPLAAGVLAPVGIILSPAVGALLMSISTIVVAINAQFLRGVKLAEPSIG
ncbi:MAG TPA: copper-translocating P-type ATPase [Aggregatilineales bacterium]|nr:copper-translocating P-type ATPase [Aggregatilineales bacterium]